MVIIQEPTINRWRKTYPAADNALRVWVQDVRRADWAQPADVRQYRADVSILQRGRVVFNICGNDFRLIVYIRYVSRTVYVKWFGTHAAYDKIDATTASNVPPAHHSD